MPRLLPGPQESVTMESISGRMLVEMGVKDPDFMPTIFSMFPEEAPLVALLDAKGYKTKGINYSSNFENSNFRTMSSNHIQYRIKQSDYRKEHFRANASGVTYNDYANPTYIGLNKTEFYIYLDSNFVGGYEVILLADGKTHLYVVDKTGGKEVSGGVFQYRVKLAGNNNDEYVNTAYMREGVEVQAGMSMYPHDFSTGGNEKYFFHGFGDTYMTLQRFKISYSGTAAAMDKNKAVGRWVQHGTYPQKAFITEAQSMMMRTLARYQNFALLEGKTTVAVDTKKITLTNDLGQEIMAGSGLLYSGDGAIEFPINNGWNEKVLEAYLADIDTYIRPNELGKRDAAMLMHPKNYASMLGTLRKMGVTHNNNILGDGNDKILNNTYAGYSFGDLTLHFHRATYMNNRPGMVLKDGTRSNEWDSILVPLGLTEGGERGIQLVQLRPMVEGTVAGIDKGGNVSNDIDGSTEHALIQNGIVSQVQCIKTYRPIANNLIA